MRSSCHSPPALPRARFWFRGQKCRNTGVAVFWMSPCYHSGHILQTYKGHEATDTGFAYAPVSQAHGHHHIVQCFALLHYSADQFCTTPGGF